MTKSIPLTQGKFALVDDEDFERVSIYKWCYMQVGYAATKVAGKLIYMHRFILNATKTERVDHADMDKLNCKRSNIRICTNSQNKINQNKLVTNTSGYKGVTWDLANNKWIAQIQVNTKHIKLGRYKTKEEAARAYDKAAIEYFGEFARLNLP